MKLTTGDRADLFGQARGLSPNLGAPFQNPMEVTPEILNEEIDAARRARKDEIARFDAYIWKLGDLLCFPEKQGY